MSYSEYLGRYKQKLTTYTDTRPKYTASHYTEVVKRVAASGNLETRVAKTACALVLNAPSTRGASGYLHGGGHTVQDTANYNEYTAGQAVAQSLKPANVKASQITNLCLSTTTLPEFNDKLAADDSGAGAIQRQRVAYARGYASNCCPTCKKVLFADGCNCKLTTAQAAALKSVNTMNHTIEPNVRVT
jgi:hypothetical protein